MNDLLELIGVIIALLGVAYSSYTDIKTGEVSDRLSHSMVGIGAIIVAFSNPIGPALWIFAMAAAVFILGFLMYIFGQIGGGDVKLFTALTLLVPYYPDSIARLMASVGIMPVSSPYPFILSLFILSGIFFMLIIPLFYLKRLFALKKKVTDFNRKIASGLVYCIILSPIFYLWLGMSKAITLLLVPMLFALMIIPFKDDLVRLFFARKKKVSQLNDDDVIAVECMKKETLARLGLWRRTFTPMELKGIKAKAKQYKISTVLVCEGLPKYVPYIFISLILNLIVGDVFLFLYGLG